MHLDSKKHSEERAALFAVRVWCQTWLNCLTWTAYLKNIYGQVFRLGRGKTPDKEGGLIKGEFVPISNGIVADSRDLLSLGFTKDQMPIFGQMIDILEGMLHERTSHGCKRRSIPWRICSTRWEESAPIFCSRSLLSTVKSWATLTTLALGSVPSPFDSDTFPGALPRSRFEVRAQTTTVPMRL